MNDATTTGGDAGQNQVQQADPGLDTAMGGWGDGEQGGAATTQQQAAPAQTQQTQQTSAPVPAQQTQQAAPTQATPAAAPAQDTASLIRAAVESTAAAMSKVGGQTQGMERAQRTMTDDEFAQRYGITKYDAKYIERLFDKDPAKAADVLNEINRNAYTAAVRMANDLVTAHAAQQESRYAPRIQTVERFIADANERAAGDRFYKAFPTLAPESDLVKEVLDATQAKISRGELKFTDEKQAFQYVADATDKVVSRMRGASGSGQQSPSGGRQMATASSSARPGGQAAPKKGTLDEVMSQWDETPAE